MATRAKLIAGLISALAFGSACDATTAINNPEPPKAVVVPVEAVKVTPQTIQLVVGETAQLTVGFGPSNATDKAVTWESTDSAIATVDATGRVTGKAVGEAVFVTVYTHDGHWQSSANITVSP